MSKDLFFFDNDGFRQKIGCNEILVLVLTVVHFVLKMACHSQWLPHVFLRNSVTSVKNSMLSPMQARHCWLLSLLAGKELCEPVSRNIWCFCTCMCDGIHPILHGHVQFCKRADCLQDPSHVIHTI